MEHTGAKMRLPSLIAAMILFPTVANAGNPVAIVEDVAANNAGVAFMDYVEAGQGHPTGR